MKVLWLAVLIALTGRSLAASPSLAPQVAPPKTKLPAPQPTAPLAIKSAPPKQVIVPGLQPGKIISMMLTGGRAPLQVTIDAGAHSQLFAPARWIDGTTQGPTISDWAPSHFTRMTVRLRCHPTLLNDHGITLRLRWVELEGPPGRELPCAASKQKIVSQAS